MNVLRIHTTNKANVPNPHYGAKMAAEMWHESDMKLNINKEELGLYLTVTCSRDRLVELGIADFCHVWRSVRGAHPGITRDEVASVSSTLSFGERKLGVHSMWR